jgi:hypothetical protein
MAMEGGVEAAACSTRAAATVHDMQEEILQVAVFARRGGEGTALAGGPAGRRPRPGSRLWP